MVDEQMFEEASNIATWRRYETQVKVTGIWDTIMYVCVCKNKYIIRVHIKYIVYIIELVNNQRPYTSDLSLFVLAKLPKHFSHFLNSHMTLPEGFKSSYSFLSFQLHAIIRRADLLRSLIKMHRILFVNEIERLN